MKTAAMVEQFISTGRLFEMLAVFVVLEVLLLLLYWRFTGRGIAPLSLLLNVGAGGALMGALWTSLVSPNALAILPWLGLSLAFHVLDISRRWQS